MPLGGQRLASRVVTGTLLALALLAAAPSPFQPKTFAKEVAAQRKLHAGLKVLPWTPNALKKLLPATCNGRTRDQALQQFVDLHEGSGVRLAYRAFDGSVVEVTLADLAGVPPRSLDAHLERFRGEADGLAPRLEPFRPVSRSTGFWHAGDAESAPRGQVMVGGRFLVQVSPASPPPAGGGTSPEAAAASPETLRACLEGIAFKTLLSESKPGKRR